MGRIGIEKHANHALILRLVLPRLVLEELDPIEVTTPEIGQKLVGSEVQSGVVERWHGAVQDISQQTGTNLAVEEPVLKAVAEAAQAAVARLVAVPGAVL